MWHLVDGPLEQDYVGEACEVRHVHIALTGHVDAGKTSLVRWLTDVGMGINSTASLDKHPDSQARGITLDLGFSAIDICDCDQSGGSCYRNNVITVVLVDCPGHGALLKTVIGGADLCSAALLLIDAAKGFQPQTLESYVLADMTLPYLVAVLNKSDCITAAKRKSLHKAVRHNLTKKGSFTDESLQVVSVSAREREGLGELVSAIGNVASRCLVRKKSDSPTIMAYDHVFEASGVGTVMTGTVLSGSIRLKDRLYVGGTDLIVKSLQAFRRPISYAPNGSRIAAVVIPSNRESFKRISERGWITSGGLFKAEPSCLFLVKVSRHWMAAENPIVSNELDDEETLRLGYGNNRPKRCQVVLCHRTLECELVIFKTNDIEQVKRGEAQRRRDLPIDDDCECLGAMRICQRADIDVHATFVGGRLDAEPPRGKNYSSKNCRLTFSGVVLELLREPLTVIRFKERPVKLIIDKSDRCFGLTAFASSWHVEKYLNCEIRSNSGDTIGRVGSPFGTKGKFLVAGYKGCALGDGHMLIIQKVRFTLS